MKNGIEHSPRPNSSPKNADTMSLASNNLATEDTSP